MNNKQTLLPIPSFSLMKKKQKIKGYTWLCGWKREASHAQVLKAA
jgi:hypothetical protein